MLDRAGKTNEDEGTGVGNGTERHEQDNGSKMLARNVQHWGLRCPLYYLCARLAAKEREREQCDNATNERG